MASGEKMNRVDHPVYRWKYSDMEDEIRNNSWTNRFFDEIETLMWEDSRIAVGILGSISESLYEIS